MQKTKIEIINETVESSIPTDAEIEMKIKNEADGRYPINETTGDLYVGSNITFKHGARFGYYQALKDLGLSTSKTIV